MPTPTKTFAFRGFAANDLRDLKAEGGMLAALIRASTAISGAPRPYAYARKGTRRSGDSTPLEDLCERCNWRVATATRLGRQLCRRCADYLREANRRIPYEAPAHVIEHTDV
jgi:thiamine pyrophosphate-dependent acetolactate synthase large subunit-like protein